MLDFINYPVSAILWFWHQVFGSVLDPAGGYTWALSVVFLVFTLRALLFKPFVHQVRSMKKMQEFAPQIKELQTKYGDDRERLAKEMQKLQSENGFNPISGCLPMIVQVPVFIGLFQVLNGFKPGADSNFIFDANGVSSFVAADLFGANLANAIGEPAEVLASFSTDRTSMLIVGVPLMVAAAIATHFTARHSVQRQTADAASNPQAAVMNRMVLWIFPMFAIIGGPFLPLAILIYWLANNFWTLAQQWVVYKRIDREEAEAKAGAVVTSTSVSSRADAPTASTASAGSATASTGIADAPVTSNTDAPAASTDAPAASTDAPAAPSSDAPVATESASKPAREDQPGEVPGAIEDRSRDADGPGESR